jgi:hypothetical protein
LPRLGRGNITRRRGAVLADRMLVIGTPTRIAEEAKGSAESWVDMNT